MPSPKLYTGQIYGSAATVGLCELQQKIVGRQQLSLADRLQHKTVIKWQGTTAGFLCFIVFLVSQTGMLHVAAECA